MPTPGVNWRIAPGEVVIVELEAGAAVVTEAAHALYRRGSLGWSLRSAGGKGLGRLMHPMLRRAAGVPTRLHRYEGPGEVALGSGIAGPVRAVELPAAAGVVVERGAMLGMTAGVSADIVLSRTVRGPRHSREVMMLQRLGGEGTAWVQAAGAAVELDVAPDETIEVAARSLVMFEGTVELELRSVKRSRLFSWWPSSDESLWAALSGPGRVVLQAATDR